MENEAELNNILAEAYEHDLDDDIDGPGQPEMSSFRPTGLDNMVDLFTGDFSYSIPLLDVGGYPINLFYNGGISMEQEASWVGLGWNINPGTISRNMRGLPDDFKGEEVRKDYNIKTDITIGVGAGKTYEIFGMPLTKKFESKISGKVNLGVFYNNYRGVGLEAGFDPAIRISNRNATEETAGMNDDENEPDDGKLGISLNSQNGLDASASVRFILGEKSTKIGGGASVHYNSRAGLHALQLHAEVQSYKNDALRAMSQYLPGLSSNISFAKPSIIPSIRIPMTTFNANVYLRFGKSYKFGILKNAPHLSGYVTETRPIETFRISKAYGYLHLEEATHPEALMDFNRINDVPYTDLNPVIAFPVYTHDIFVINGEGTGGSFRGYRGDIGYVRDQETKSVSTNFSLGVGLNKATTGTGGKIDINVEPVHTRSEVGAWRTSNIARKILEFTKSDRKYQSVYFKNPAEKTIIDKNFYEAVGGENLVRLSLEEGQLQASVKPVLEVFDPVTREALLSKPLNRTNTLKVERDKRSQVITALTAYEASIAGLTKKIEYYPINVFPRGDCDSNLKSYERIDLDKLPAHRIRQPHHLSEITVLGSDGKRHVYGIPVYNYKQFDVTFNVQGRSVNQEEGTVNYQDDDNSTANERGSDHYFQKETIPGYAHSYLLTGLLSPDYVDLKDDGITEDDPGNAIKFNYSKVHFGNEDFVRWRAPFTRITMKASYSPGLLTDNTDDKANYSYGEKEIWYLNSVESKTMIAVFKVSNNRNDGKEATGEDGGINNSKGNYRLDTIHLYTKAMFNKYGEGAKPVKSVIFEYAAAQDELCQDVENANNNSGKLTLKRVWFAYGKIYKKKNNKPINGYHFKYKNNKPYDRLGNDRWGNYKNPSHLPAGLNTSDHPYVHQAGFEDEIAPWQLEEIILPSGGKVKVTYEHDDYAFVQDKRAAVMTKVAGFGSSTNGTFSNKLYDVQGLGFTDRFYVYFKTAETLPSNEQEAKQKIKDLYLADLNQLYLKLFVKVPSDQLGSGHESIGLYADIIDWGPSPDRNTFYVKVGGVNDKVSHVCETIFQFAKDNLPSKIYPGYNTRDEGAVKALVVSLVGMVKEIVRVVGGFDNTVRHERKFQLFDSARSYGRLSRHDFKKLGGGYRVKEVRISDQWDVMTSQYKSELGQTYDYTTKIMVNGEEVTASSGVASYEPSIGNEENPFREVLRTRISKALAKDQFIMQELPVGEMFYPSAMVGYSKIRISSIKKGNVKNGTSIQEVCYFTTKDFPTISNYTTFDPQSKIKYRPDIWSTIMNMSSVKMDNLSQGLLISLNDMNGKMKSQATYAEGNLESPVSYTENIYRMNRVSESKAKLNNLVSVIKDPGGRVYEDELVGKDVELMVDFREHYSQTRTPTVFNFNLEILRLVPPIIIPIFKFGTFSKENIYRSASLVKIVNTYGILDSVISIDKGSMVGTRNLVYDGNTGDVLLNRTSNEFDNPVYNFSFPAHWRYEGMGPAIKNVGAEYRNIHIRDGRIVSGNIIDDLESGDELLVLRRPILKAPLQSIGCMLIDGPIPGVASKDNVIWAIDIRKDEFNTTKDFIFVNRYGKLFTGIIDVKILRSGHRNMLGATVGNVVSLSSPIQKQGGIDHIIFDNEARVLNAGVQEFKEMWRVDSLLREKDTQVVVSTSGTYAYYDLSSQDAFSLYGKYDNKMLFNGKELPINSFWEVEEGFRTAFWVSKIKRGLFKKTLQGEGYKSWMLFNLPTLPNNTYVTFSRLTLGAKPILNNVLPHNSISPITNTQYLQRTRHPWYNTTNLYAWKEVFLNNRTPGTTIVYPSTMISDNGSPLGMGRKDAYVNVTSLVREMFYDKAIGLNYATAFKVSLKDDQLEGVPLRNSAPEHHWMNYTNFKSDGDDCYTLTRTSATPQPSTCTRLAVQCLTCPSGYTLDSLFYFKNGWYYFCSQVQKTKVCELVFKDSIVNPYTTGLLGNWRPFRSLVYYGNRVESNDLAAVDLSKGGVIENFTSYWTFNSSGLTTSSPSQWVWNSEITQINSAGAEIENKDPLGSYNAGVYGYNERLPIAIANNSMYQELGFDGFEDYDFHTQDCEPFCKKSRRIQFTSSNPLNISDEVSHSGLYSLKINPGNSVSVGGSVVPDGESVEHGMRIRMNYASQVVSVVNGNGIGLYGEYYSNNNFTGTMVQQLDPALTFNWGNSISPNNAKSIRWEGSLQSPESGIYKLKVEFSGGRLKVWAGGNQLYDAAAGSAISEEILLGQIDQGDLKTIKIEYIGALFWNFLSVSPTLKIQWKKDGESYSTIPASLIYPQGLESMANNTVSSETFWCIKPESSRPVGNYLLDGFNLVRDRQMVVSAWVKEGGTDCQCATYDNNYLEVSFNGQTTTGELKPTENIIDGWQRLEGVFTVPSNATTFSFDIVNTSGSNAVYYDDIRIHPFNSNMKSFVYHPESLRLMAELDENNYASFYEYDEEGTLVRVKKETEKGVKTISESRSATQKLITE